MFHTPWQIGPLQLPHRLIQGPLAGYSCAPFRSLFYQFTAPAYCVTEMCSAVDVISKHQDHSRYIYRDPIETVLAYQLSGTDPDRLAEAALRLEHFGADLIDLNCGCPKAKIRKKGAGSALLDEPDLLIKIIRAMRAKITIALTVKIRIQGTEQDLILAQQIEAAGADALVVHGRRWVDDYDKPNDLVHIGKIKQAITIPVIANGDITDSASLHRAMELSGCDGFMIGRGGTGRPWLYQELLEQRPFNPDFSQKIELLMTHLDGLAKLENEYKAVLQSKSLGRYYFKTDLDEQQLRQYRSLNSLAAIRQFLQEQFT